MLLAVGPSRRKTHAGRRLRLCCVAAVLALLGALVIGATPATAAPVAAAAPVTRTFPYAGGAQRWTVPTGVTSATFDLYGAQGGAGLTPDPATGFGVGGAGGEGADIRATVAVTSGENLEIVVGGQGMHGDGGFNGGGSAISGIGNVGGGGGGGASDVRRGGTFPENLANRILVAGGGGGGGASGASHSAIPPSSKPLNGADGGASGSVGQTSENQFCCPTDQGGQPGTATGGGAGGEGQNIVDFHGFDGLPGAPGVLGAGGNGGDHPLAGLSNTGGGGGGGYYGGGGGGSGGAEGDVLGGFFDGAGGGGGGGASFTASGASDVVVDEGARSGNGLIRVTYTGPTCSITQTISEANGDTTASWSITTSAPMNFTVFVLRAATHLFWSTLVGAESIPAGTKSYGPFTFVPPSRTVGWLAVAGTRSGILCSDFDLVDTGPPPQQSACSGIGGTYGTTNLTTTAFTSVHWACNGIECQFACPTGFTAAVLGLQSLCIAPETLAVESTPLPLGVHIDMTCGTV